MDEPKNLPQTLIEVIRYFSDQDVCVQFVARLRWPDGPVCPSCGGMEHSYLKTRRLWKCKSCKRQFSAKVGSIFEDSPIPLDKWLAAMWMIANSKDGVSSHEMARSLGITQKSAWFLLHRIRLAMRTGTFQKLDGEIEADETFIGGKARNMHKSKRAKKITGTGGKDKAIVAGVLQRGGEVRAGVVPNTKQDTLQAGVREHVKKAPRSMATRWCPTPGLMTNTSMRSSTTLRSTSTARCTSTALRTSGACSSAACTAPTSPSNPSTCSATSMSGCSPTTNAGSPT
jgi:transposase-like protein